MGWIKPKKPSHATVPLSSHHGTFLFSLPSGYQSCLLRPSVPVKLGRTPIRDSTLAFGLCDGDWEVRPDINREGGREP
jgi:hypothetical protein